MNNPGCFLLKGVLQHYAWGGMEFIPTLLGVDNVAQEPCAELWFGAHTKAPSLALLNEHEAKLDRLLAQHPEWLGKRVQRQFGRLPFLLKVLDARDMLSIQVHPTRQQAEQGFALENEKGIPLDAAERNYKDDNHKPEVHVALTEFWMLHGFRPEEEIERQLRDVNEFAPLRHLFSSGGLEGLYRGIMTAPQDEIDAWLRPLLTRLETQKPDDPDKPDYWALKAARTFPLPGGHVDRGIFSIYLLNLLHLKPGQGTFQDAGVLHAYLHGANVELMANSDNVLRGGLTQKHVDVDELLRIVDVRGHEAEVLHGVKIDDAEQIYNTPAADFQLSRLQLPKGSNLRRHTDGPEIWLLMQGVAEMKSGGARLLLQKGKAAFVCSDGEIEFSVLERAELFRASVPAEA